MNTTTADSYSEGFAEFMSLVASDMYGDKNAHVYAGFGSLEVNFKAYGDLGRDEELALAGILWDVYDNDDTYENGNDDDTISMPIDQLMNILFTPYQNFTEVYEALLEYYKDKPNDLKGINEIFLSHGFFIETAEGNKTRDSFEPYLDGSNKKTKDKSYTDGEYFVDYPANNVFSHDEKEVIGTPSTYNRTDRKTAVVLPGHLMHMEGNQETFTISVEFEAYPHLNFTIETKKDENGMIQLPVPSEDYDSVITISGQTGDLYQFTTADFYNRFDASVEQGYFDTIQCPDIYLEDTSTEVVLVHIDNESAMPHYESRAAALEKGVSE
ncbi:MAG: hypothetical protein JXQ23_07740, partial [Clostridia bacterium]|nr:hypothetical protein [Clostridia bacterium]